MRLQPQTSNINYLLSTKIFQLNISLVASPNIRVLYCIQWIYFMEDNVNLFWKIYFSIKLTVSRRVSWSLICIKYKIINEINFECIQHRSPWAMNIYFSERGIKWNYLVNVKKISIRLIRRVTSDIKILLNKICWLDRWRFLLSFF